MFLKKYILYGEYFLTPQISDNYIFFRCVKSAKDNKPLEKYTLYKRLVYDKPSLIRDF